MLVQAPNKNRKTNNGIKKAAMAAFFIETKTFLLVHPHIVDRHAGRQLAVVDGLAGPVATNGYIQDNEK